MVDPANGPKADLDTARRFLAGIDPQNRVGASHAFHTRVDPVVPTRNQAWGLAHDPSKDPRFDAPFDDVAPELQRLNREGAAVLVAVNDDRRAPDHTDDSKLVLRACCCSWTGGEFGTHDGYTVPLRPADDRQGRVRAGPPPSLVVRTPTSVQWWWLLHASEDEPSEARQKWERVQRALAVRHGGDPGLHEVGAVLRVPGFLYQRQDPLDPTLHRRVEEELRARIARGDLDVTWGTPAAEHLVHWEYAARGGGFVPVDLVRLEKCDTDLRYEIGRLERGFDLDVDPPPEIVSPRQLSVPDPDLGAAGRYLETLGPGAERHTFQTYDDRGSDPELAKIFHGTLDELAPALAAINRRGGAVNATVHATDFRGRGNHNVVSTRAFFCDWDDAVPPPGAGALPLTMLVSRDAGGRRKYHGYWALAEPVEPKRWRLVQRALVERLGADPAAVLLNQALRLPGFCNNKGEPVVVELEQCHPEHRYTVDQVVETYQLEDLMKPPPPRPERTSDDGGPADDYNERGDWSVLERRGWTVALRDGDEVRWTKPGGGRREVHATTDHDGHVGIFMCFSSKAPPFEANKAYSRFQVLAELEFGNDFSATAKHLVEQRFGKSSEERRREYAEALNAEEWAATLNEDAPEDRPRVVKKEGPNPPDPHASYGSSSAPANSAPSQPTSSVAYAPDRAPAGSGGARKPPAKTSGASGGGPGGDGDGDGDGDLPVGDGQAPVLLPLNSVKTYANGPDQLVMSHLGNSERFLDRYRKLVRYVRTFDSWYVWNGLRWRQDKDAEELHVRPPAPKGNKLKDYIEASNPDPFDAADFVQELGKQVMRRMHELTEHVFVQETDDDGNKIVGSNGKPKKDKDKTFSARKKWIKHCVSSESEGAIRQMLNLARSDRKLARFPSYFDPYDHLLNTESGVQDLRTGLLYEHHPGLLQSKLVRIKPKRSGCPTWTKFLGRVLQDDDDLIRFIQLAVGYSLTGETREQKIFLLYGTGRNGKSTFLNVLHALAGEYAQHAEFSTFIERQSETVRNDLARLHKSRLVTAVEPKASGYLDESVIKQVTGQDVVTARFLFQEHFEFVPRFKIWLAANHKPMIRGNDEGIWRRILMVPFTVTIPEEEKDPDLPKKLIAELPGIFAWAADGAKLWYQHGLRVPEAVLEATQAYRDDMDTIGMFISTMCMQKDGVRARATALYERYRKWVERAGEKPMSQKKFGMRLEERGILKKRTRTGYEYIGIGILDDSVAGASHDDALPYKDD